MGHVPHWHCRGCCAELLLVLVMLAIWRSLKKHCYTVKLHCSCSAADSYWMTKQCAALTSTCGQNSDVGGVRWGNWKRTLKEMLSDEESPCVSQTSDPRGTMWFSSRLWNIGPTLRPCESAGGRIGICPTSQHELCAPTSTIMQMLYGSMVIKKESEDKALKLPVCAPTLNSEWELRLLIQDKKIRMRVV